MHRKIKKSFQPASCGPQFSDEMWPWVGKIGPCNFELGLQGGLTEGQREELYLYNFFAGGPLNLKGNIQ